MSYPEVSSRVHASLVKSGGSEFLRKLKLASPHTERHTREVGDLAMRLGCVLPGVDESVVLHLGFSGTLHDIGKTAPAIHALVNAPRKLSDPECEQVRQVHTRDGSRKITGLIKGRTGYERLLGTAAYVALHHHDAPSSLTEKVHASPLRPMITGLIHVIDKFEALQAPDRPYRDEPPVASPEEAAALIMLEQTPPFFDIEPETIMETLVDVAKKPELYTAFG